ncbi:DNA repair protein, swi5 [Niveomyces insectorum RCEF 264]|uniref:DNA repair protein, swi5 n=1 Tax=Niveomyces insectorum RCEF 264 TaxID=1081102 RepID=A0A167PDC9_9HYPO|nr:DNA repair protein, swi5 [Niveomyces insectorum RCEF 264]
MPQSAQNDLQALLARHRRFLVQAQALVAKDASCAQEPGYKAFIALLLERLRAHEAWLLSKQTGKHSDCPVQWSNITVAPGETEAETSALFLRIAGPGVDDVNTITVKDEEAATKRSSVLARAAQQASLVVARQNLDGHTQQQPQLSNKEATDRNGNVDADADADANRRHIARLKQYNDLRDVGQQLIGIIADNRGVPVRSLYADDRFGVGPDD